MVKTAVVLTSAGRVDVHKNLDFDLIRNQAPSSPAKKYGTVSV